MRWPQQHHDGRNLAGADVRDLRTAKKAAAALSAWLECALVISAPVSSFTRRRLEGGNPVDDLELPANAVFANAIVQNVSTWEIDHARMRRRRARRAPPAAYICLGQLASPDVEEHSGQRKTFSRAAGGQQDALAARLCGMPLCENQAPS
jgi:hypothetical protein